MLPELAGAGAVIVAAGVLYARALISLNRRLNDLAERLARLEGLTEHDRNDRTP